MYWYSEVTNSTATDYNLKDTEECKTIFLETAWNISNDFSKVKSDGVDSWGSQQKLSCHL